ncbi:hypothetical protein [Dictyobacter aurantiacus]|uniref:Uncharacterized protein n=1 Tax=Dictyobacter aurantiacus TaxID=1936993 RepID=A0A401ZDF9_9CHLR|nr:hypothetical protein [Dictyobacter aurantiacus]GCE04879.1 hypothetical protein KDAU_22080 [Dictyobacter aurantiacus]
MRVEMYKLAYGNYKFCAEIDTGAEVGDNQLTLWYSEKLALETLSLAQLDARLLLKALKEPHKSLLLPYLDEIKHAEQQSIEQEIARLLQPYSTQKIPGNVKQRIRQLREKIHSMLQTLEARFVQEEILTLDRDSFDLNAIEQDCHIYGEWHFLRDFFFEEATYDNIRRFCHDFALDEAVRQEAIAREARWAKRNALFTRNLLSVVGEKALLSNDGSYMRSALELFRWLDLHFEEVLANPEYQRINALDQPAKNMPPIHDSDASIRPAVELFKNLPGTAIRHSCQGVSAKIDMGDYSLLTITPHEEYAYIAFNTMGYLLHDAIIDRLHEFPTITTERIPCNFNTGLFLRSTGDNIRFREEIYQLARQIHSILTAGCEARGSDEPERLITGWETANNPAYPPQTSDCADILPGRLEWLCLPEQIEGTLLQISHLNHWAKAADRLYYDDRQGLYSVKARFLKQAYYNGTVQPVGYVDGGAAFPKNFAVESAAAVAADFLLETLEDKKRGQRGNEYSNAAMRLFQRITGQPFLVQDKEQTIALKQEQAEAVIHSYLHDLIEQARQTHQPIAHQRLEELLVFPGEILDIAVTRYRYISTWDDLDKNELRKLDPEGLSLISFGYESASARYIFHLPFRTAQEFLPEDEITRLRGHVSSERKEYGSAYGRTITAEESNSHPIEELLQTLGVNISKICPHKLERKQERTIQPSRQWHEPDNNEDGYQQYLYEMPRKKHKARKKKRPQ